MLKVFFENSDDVAAWVMRNLGQQLASPYWAIGVTDNGSRILGGVVFNSWNGSNIGITIYGPGCMKRSIVRGVFAYAFRGLKARRITALTLSSNSRMRAILPRLGFTHECDMPEYYETGGASQYRLLRDDWRLGKFYGCSKTTRSGCNRERASSTE